MKLFEHPDFEQSILRAAEHFQPRGLRPAIIEKDYYLTEALRIVAATGDKVIFKGGTSLAKGESNTTTRSGWGHCALDGRRKPQGPHLQGERRRGLWRSPPPSCSPCPITLSCSRPVG
jgi:hypothetical protein